MRGQNQGQGQDPNQNPNQNNSSEVANYEEKRKRSKWLARGSFACYTASFFTMAWGPSTALASYTCCFWTAFGMAVSGQCFLSELTDNRLDTAAYRVGIEQGRREALAERAAIMEPVEAANQNHVASGNQSAAVGASSGAAGVGSDAEISINAPINVSDSLRPVLGSATAALSAGTALSSLASRARQS